MNRRGFFNLLPAIGLLGFIPKPVEAGSTIKLTDDKQLIPLSFLSLHEFTVGKDLKNKVILGNRELYTHYPVLCHQERIYCNTYELSNGIRGFGYMGMPIIYHPNPLKFRYDSQRLEAKYCNKTIYYEMALVPGDDVEKLYV